MIPRILLVFFTLLGFSEVIYPKDAKLDITHELGVKDIINGDADEDWSFIISRWCVEEKEKGTKRVSITVDYQIPENRRVILMVGKNWGLREKSLDSKSIQDPLKGKVTLEFEEASRDYVYCIFPWIGSPRNVSPSGILGGGVIVDLSPNIISMTKDLVEPVGGADAVR